MRRNKRTSDRMGIRSLPEGGFIVSLGTGPEYGGGYIDISATDSIEKAAAAIKLSFDGGEFYADV